MPARPSQVAQIADRWYRVHSANLLRRVQSASKHVSGELLHQIGSATNTVVPAPVEKECSIRHLIKGALIVSNRLIDTTLGPTRVSPNPNRPGRSYLLMSVPHPEILRQPLLPGTIPLPRRSFPHAYRSHPSGAKTEVHPHVPKLAVACDFLPCLCWTTPNQKCAIGSPKSKLAAFSKKRSAVCHFVCKTS